MITDLLTLAQWLSPAFPTGAFAYSHGLEWAIAAGQVRDAASLQSWLSGVVTHGSGWQDALLFLAAQSGDLADLNALAQALAPSAERLRETQDQGAALVLTVNSVWGFDLPPLVLPVAVGAAVARARISADIALPLYLHSFISNLANVATRAMPLGQTAAQAIVSQLSPICVATAQAAKLADLDDLGGCAYLADIAAMNHETQAVRIFRS